MATNSVLNQGLAPQFVAAETLRTLVPVLQPIKEIAVTDFSSYVDRIGNVVHTRLASPLTSALVRLACPAASLATCAD